MPSLTEVELVRLNVLFFLSFFRVSFATDRGTSTILSFTKKEWAMIIM